MMTGGNTSDRMCDISPSSDCLMTTSGDTSDGRCEDHDMSPRSDRLMMIGGDTSREGVRAMIGAPVHTTS